MKNLHFYFLNLFIQITVVGIAVGDQMFLGMQDFDFAQIESLLPKIRLYFSQILL